MRIRVPKQAFAKTADSRNRPETNARVFHHCLSSLASKKPKASNGIYNLSIKADLLLEDDLL
jgi:hypothetical protein